MAIRSLDVRRQRHVTERVDHRIDVTAALDPQSDRSAAVKMSRYDFAEKYARWPLEPYLRARLQLLSGVHQGLGDPHVVWPIHLCRPLIGRACVDALSSRWLGWPQ